MQLLHEIEVAHLPHWFSKKDEAEMEHHNKQYYVLNDVERLFLDHFAVPQKDDEGKFMEPLLGTVVVKTKIRGVAFSIRQRVGIYSVFDFSHTFF